MRRLALLLVLASIVALRPAPAAADGAWPFGKDPRPGTWSRGRDLYNLGLLGAKARGVDDPGPGARTDLGGGRTRIEPTGAPASDDGPTQLAVELLYPRGPAEAAGLKVGDVIVGVGRSTFQGPALAPLAEALTKAEAGRKKGAVTLRVLRGSEKVKIDVQVPVADKSAAKPTEGAGRQRIVDAALAWLAERQDARGGYEQTLSGTNGAVVVTSLAGLAWLAGGSDLEHGPYRENVEKAAAFVEKNAGVTMRLPPGVDLGGTDRLSKMQGMDQTNWGYAHAGIFLGELAQRHRRPKIRAALERCAAQLAKTQEPSGGWAHGPGGPNPLGYTELNIVTGLALCALGSAHRAGWTVPEGVLERAEDYLERSSGGDGGVGYSAEAGQRGQGNIGRTAGCWLGYRALGLGKSAWGRKMGKWVERHVADVFGGHASLMQHVLLAGVAANALGRRAQKAYWEVAEREMVLARAPDGSFQPRPWHESLQMASSSDVTFGDVWTTAAWTIVLASLPEKGGRPGLPAWLTLND